MSLKINFFAGGRRLLIVFLALGSIAILVSHWSKLSFPSQVRVTVTLAPVIWDGKTGGLVVTRTNFVSFCSFDDFEMEIKLTDPKKDDYRFLLCVEPDQKSNKIPYVTDDLKFSVADKKDPNLKNWIVEHFSVLFGDDQKLVERIRSLRWRHVKDELFVLIFELGALLIGSWILATTMGWVLRGFMGIPKGKDSA